MNLIIGACKGGICTLPARDIELFGVDQFPPLAIRANELLKLPIVARRVLAAMTLITRFAVTFIFRAVRRCLICSGRLGHDLHQPNLAHEQLESRIGTKLVEDAI